MPDTFDPGAPASSAGGRFHGLRTADVCRFSGIAYAQPPVGPLRFAPPQPLAADALDVDGSAPSPIALQNPSRLSGVMGDLEHLQSEDCLRLTVWTPGTAGPLRPVLVWLHGGAFLSGGGAVPWYDGALLAREGGVVVVAPNYRLGAAGFLCAEGLADGNIGLLDVEAALAWVQAHIAQFGGDPSQVTLMGQSAGAWLATAVAGRMQQERAPVHRLLLMSTPGALAPAPRSQAHAVSRVLLRHAVGQDDAAAGAAATRALAPSRLLAAQDAAIREIATRFSAPGLPPTAFGPVEDAALPGGAGYADFLARAAARVPVLVGWTRDEMLAFHPAGSPAAQGTRGAAAQLFRDPSLRWAEAAARGGQRAYVYRFDWQAPGNPFGACHCIELPFVFGSFEAFASAPMLQGADAARMQALSARLRAAWLAFVRSGDPNTAGAQGLPSWPAHDGSAHASVLHIDDHSHLLPQESFA